MTKSDGDVMSADRSYATRRSKKNLNAQHESDAWKRFVAVLALGWVVIWISRMMFTPIYPVLGTYFGGASNAELGIIASTYFLGYVIMQIPSGLLVERVGMRCVVVPGFLVFALGRLIMASARTLGRLYVGSLVAGLGCGSFYGVAYAITTILVPRKHRSFATAVVNSGTAIGSGLGMASASGLVETVGIPWNILVAVTAILAGGMAVLFWRVLPTGTPAQTASQKDNSYLGKTRLIAACIVYFSALYAYYLMSAWLPHFLASERGFDAALSGAVSALLFFAGIPGALVFSRLADLRPQLKKSLIIGLQLAAALAVSALALPLSTQLVILVIAVYGFVGKLAVEPIIISWMANSIAQAKISLALGILNTCGMSAAVLSPALSGLLGDVIGTGVYGFVAAAFLLFCLTLVFHLLCTKSQTCQRYLK